MRTLHSSALVAIAFAGGCVSQAETTPEYATYDDSYAGLSSGPGDESYSEPHWSGPPGGAMDPGYGYADPHSSSAESATANADSAMSGGEAYGEAYADPTAAADPSVDPNATGEWAGATADVTDAQIDVTLEGYGEWVEDPDYGRVWRPYTTVVGADFTPYESCGSWTYTEYGWTFQSCNEWSWGWLPFHYGRWVYLDNSWCWSRDYTWGPGWVEWRHGGGYVGWRPLSPTRSIRDHRDRASGPRVSGDRVRDHRRGRSDKWNFTREADFGRGRTRPSRSIDINDGLRATTAVAHPPLRGTVRNRVSTVMAGRLRDHQRFDVRSRGQMGQSTRGYQPSPVRGHGVGPSRGPSRGYTNSIGATRGYNPSHNPTVVSPNPNRPSWNRGNTGYRYNGANGGDRFNPPSSGVNGGNRYNPPTGYRAPNNGVNGGYRYNPPGRAPNNGVNGGYRYNPPSNTRTPPASSGGYRSSPPSRSGGYRASPSFGGSRGSTTAPSRPSTSYGGSRSSSPSRSYSAPSRSSSSYSAPSRSSSSSSRGSSSSSSRGSSSGGSRSRR